MDFSELLVYEKNLVACYEAEYLLTVGMFRTGVFGNRSKEGQIYNGDSSNQNKLGALSLRAQEIHDNKVSLNGLSCHTIETQTEQVSVQSRKRGANVHMLDDTNNVEGNSMLGCRNEGEHCNDMDTTDRMGKLCSETFSKLSPQAKKKKLDFTGTPNQM